MVGHLAKGLAFAFLAGPWSETELVSRGRSALGETALGRARWLRRTVRRVLVALPAAPVDGEDELAAMLEDDRGLRGAARRVGSNAPFIRRWLIPDATMVPVDGPPVGFRIRPIPSPGALADALGLGLSELAWFADEKRMNVRATDVRLSHYHLRWVAKARGGWRLLEAPKPRLKRIQRWLLDEILASIPPSEVAHGFVPGRSVRTFVAPHVGRAVVVRMDLEDFFTSVSRARVVSLFRRVGYPRRVAAALAGLSPPRPRNACSRPDDDAALKLLFLSIRNAKSRPARAVSNSPICGLETD